MALAYPSGPLTSDSKNCRLIRDDRQMRGNSHLNQRITSMKRQLFGIAVLMAVVSTASAQNWFKGSLDEALAKAKTENKKVLVDFFSPT